MHAPSAATASDHLEVGFRLGGLGIDPKAGEVAGPGGTEKLDPKVMAVLVMLAEHAGQVVLREDLLTRLWPNVVVTDESLSRCIYELRRQLAQAGGNESFKELIETLPKRGYRLKGEVAPLAPEPASSPRRARSPWILVAVVAVVAVVAAIGAGLWVRASRDSPAPAAAFSIAVLPFVDMSENRDQAHLSDGIAEEILNHLTRLSDLRVIARTSSFSFRDRPLDIQEIAKRLDVTHMLEGSVRKSGNRVRVTAQLISASDGAHLWSETYDRTLDDMFAIQDEIAAHVAIALQATLRPGFTDQESAVNVDAYESVLQGEHFYYRRGPGDAERSVVQFERALEFDPDYARAWADLSAAYGLLAWQTDPPSKEIQSRQRDAALRAVELDPNLAVAQRRLADYYAETGDSDNSRKHYELALKLAPNDSMSLSHSAGALVEAGEYEAAIAIQKTLVARDPLNAVSRQILNVALMADGRLEEALSSYETMLDLNPNANPDWILEIPRILVLLGRYKEAVEAALRLPPGKFRDQAMSLMSRAPGYRDEAAAALARLETYLPAPQLEGPQDRIMNAVRLAETYAFIGRTDLAFATLTKKLDELMQQPETATYAWYLRFESRLSPFLKPLHSDPRWAEFASDPS